MKKFSVLLTLAVLMVSSSVFAGSIDYLSNQSAKYCMNTASTARTDGADIVAYNPAGTALMGQGFFIDVSNQTLIKPYKQDATYTAASIDESYSQSTPTYLLPNVYAVYNFGAMGPGKLAAYAQLGVVAGGGSLEWDGTAGSVGAGLLVANTIGLATAGIPVAFNADVNGSSVYYGVGAGVSYAFLEDMISVSAGARYTIARRTGELKGTIDYAGGAVGAWTLSVDSAYDYNAEGITPIFGFDVKPVKELTIGVRYEMETELEFKYDQTSNDVSTTSAALNGGGAPTLIAGMLDKDGDKLNSNLPQILSVGAEYAVMPELTVGVSTNIYFLGDADMEGYEDYFGTGWEVAVGATYKVMDSLKVAGSVMYTDQGAKDELYTDDNVLTNVSGNPVLNSWFFGVGTTYTVIPNLDLSVALSWVHYLPKDATTDNGIEVSYKKDVYNVAIGAGYKI